MNSKKNIKTFVKEKQNHSLNCLLKENKLYKLQKEWKTQT